MKKKSGQNDDFNPFKGAPKAEHANIMARANNTAPMVHKHLTVVSLNHRGRQQRQIPCPLDETMTV